MATTPKPGLIDRNSSPQAYLQYISSSVALYTYFRKAATTDRLGKVIYSACRDMLQWQRGGNTHLGAILLLTPLARAAYLATSFNGLRKVLGRVLHGMDYVDAVKVVEAIKLVGPGGLGRVALYDVNNPETPRRIKEERASVLTVLKPYAGYEVVATEYTNTYLHSFEHGFAYLVERLGDGESLNNAGVNTFLNILAHLPDSHVARRHGWPAARMLSHLAEQVLAAGGVSTPRGRALFQDFAAKVVRAGFKPAATADILAASYTLLMLSGYRP